MAIRKFRAGTSSYNASTYVGTYGTIFYDEDTGNMRISDGVTPGGKPLTLVSDDFAFAFGDFIANTPSNGHATLSSLHVNQTIDIKSNGSGEINLTGQVNVYDANGVFGDQPIFKIKTDGQIRMLVPLADVSTGALEIIGNTSGVSHPPNQTGVILHVTGNNGLVSRNYFDASNNYSLIVGRRYNGTASNTSPVLANEVMFRIASQGSTDNSFEQFGPARMEFVATQNQAPNAQGGEIQLYATANNTSGSMAIKVASINATTGITATKFNGPLTGNVTGNIVSVNTGTTVLNTANTVAAFTGNVTGNVTGNIVSVNTGTTVLNTANTVAAFTGNVTGNIVSVNTGTTVLNTANTVAAFTGNVIRTTRNAGIIADSGTLTVDFSTDDIIQCDWGNGLVLAYQNFTAGRVVKVIATKLNATGTDSINLDGVTASHVSAGSTSISASSNSTTFIELICTGSTLASVFIKL